MTKTIHALALSCTMLAACADDVDAPEAPREESALESSQQAIKSGFTPTTSPFVVGLTITKEGPDADYQDVCTGIVLTPHWVMTAAHCLLNHASQSYVGLQVWRQTPSGNQRVVDDPEGWKTWPLIPANHASGLPEDDVGLIHLNIAMNPAPTTAETARIYTGSNDPRNFSPDQHHRIAGWGFGNTMTNESCAPLTALVPRGGWFRMTSWNSTLATLTQTRGQEVCKGDSGGAVYYTINNIQMTFALAVSYTGQSTCWNGVENVCSTSTAVINAARLSRYMNWVQDVSRQTPHPIRCLGYTTTTPGGQVVPFRRCQ